MNRLTLLLPLLLLIGCSTKEDTADATRASAEHVDNLDYVNLSLNWFPEAEHGGYYAALVHGFYEEAGLGVTIRPGGPNAPVVQEVALGRTEFGIANADQILIARGQEAPIKALFAPLQNSPRCLMVHEASGIDGFDDMNDMTIALSDGKPFAMFLRKKFSFKNVDFVPYPGNVSEFLLKEKFAQQAYVFSEPFVAKESGGDPKTLMVSDTGFNPYASVLFASDKMLENDAETIQRFVAATAKGWEQYLKDPTRTNEHIAKQNADMGMDILNFGAKSLQSLCQPTPDVRIGSMTLERWQTLREQMEDIAAMNADDFSTEEAFTNDFLRKE